MDNIKSEDIYYVDISDKCNNTIPCYHDVTIIFNNEKGLRTKKIFHIDSVKIACILRDISYDNLHFIDYWNDSFTKDRIEKMWSDKLNIKLSKDYSFVFKKINKTNYSIIKGLNVKSFERIIDDNKEELQVIFILKNGSKILTKISRAHYAIIQKDLHNISLNDEYLLNVWKQRCKYLILNNNYKYEFNEKIKLFCC